jgi:hypothetical protein
VLRIPEPDGAVVSAGRDEYPSIDGHGACRVYPAFVTGQGVHLRAAGHVPDAHDRIEPDRREPLRPADLEQAHALDRPGGLGHGMHRLPAREVQYEDEPVLARRRKPVVILGRA